MPFRTLLILILWLLRRAPAFALKDAIVQLLEWLLDWWDDGDVG